MFTDRPWFAYICSLPAAEVREKYYNLIKPVAERYSLLLDGSLVSSEPSIGNITMNWDEATEPSPISPFSLDSVAWNVFSRAIQASFGADVLTAPSAMTGNTGMLFYWSLVVVFAHRALLLRHTTLCSFVCSLFLFSAKMRIIL